MSLTLEVEFLTGVCRAAREPGDDEPDWPPQPDRVFSALVSAWAARGEQPDERAALEWLEAQAPPVIHASGYTARTTPDVFVPPNDPRQSTADKTYIKVMPDMRPRQPRRFPVARPDDPHMVLVWHGEPEAQVLASLNALAGCIGYLGHSASLARCRFVTGAAATGRQPLSQARRRVYPGRLRELEEAHRLYPARPIIRPGASVFAQHPQSTEPSDGWLVLETVGGDVPDIRAAALVCRLLRRTLMSGYRKAGLEQAIPEVVSGHDPDAAPTRMPHLAIAPMAFAGFSNADGRVLGFALVPPPGISLVRVPGFLKAFEAAAPYRSSEERRVLTLEGPPLGKPLRLAPAVDERTGKRSLSPGPYVDCSRIWASVTPVVLERHLKRRDEAERRELIAVACENAALPRPDLDRIRVGKHSALEGVPPARPLAGEPPWTGWKIPKSLASRPLVHTVIDFGQEIPGPVLLGAGRFTGLGLCRGVDR